jgi:hypothetical protein
VKLFPQLTILLLNIHAAEKRALKRVAAVHHWRGDDYPIIVHCHLCWDWVWQRPQQFVSRLSTRHKILFVETLAPDPQLASAFAHFRVAEKFPNITILRLQFPAWR